MGVLRRLTGRSAAERYLERGLVHFQKNKVLEALADLTEAIALEPFNAEYYTTRGFIYIQGEDDEYREFARADFEYAIHLDPDQWVAEYCLGLIAYYEQDYVQALQRFFTAQQEAPERAEILYCSALCYYYLDHVEVALQNMEAAFDIFEEQKDRAGLKVARKWRTLLRKEMRTLKKQQKSLQSGKRASGRSTSAGRPEVIDMPLPD